MAASLPMSVAHCHFCPILVTDNDAEYLTDIVTEADRMGRGGEFADAYLK